jgi:nucleolar protein 58
LKRRSISVKLKAFKKFENTTDALSAVTGIVEGKLPKNLKKFLETEISEKEMKKEKLVISDPKLGTIKKGIEKKRIY